jgi:hypothetical protein
VDERRQHRTRKDGLDHRDQATKCDHAHQSKGFPKPLAFVPRQFVGEESSKIVLTQAISYCQMVSRHHSVGDSRDIKSLSYCHTGGCLLPHTHRTNEPRPG